MKCGKRRCRGKCIYNSSRENLIQIKVPRGIRSTSSREKSTKYSILISQKWVWFLHVNDSLWAGHLIKRECRYNIAYTSITLIDNMSMCTKKTLTSTCGKEHGNFHVLLVIVIYTYVQTFCFIRVSFITPTKARQKPVHFISNL